jgi:hypothetical protein
MMRQSSKSAAPFSPPSHPTLSPHFPLSCLSVCLSPSLQLFASLSVHAFVHLQTLREGLCTTSYSINCLLVSVSNALVLNPKPKPICVLVYV